jgi:hypothetical protein
MAAKSAGWYRVTRASSREGPAAPAHNDVDCARDTPGCEGTPAHEPGGPGSAQVPKEQDLPARTNMVALDLILRCQGPG